MIKKRLYILMFSLFFLITLVFVCVISVNANNENRELSIVYRLMAYDNNIALYENQELIKVYDDIVLNSLPKYDQELFKKGIIVSEISEIDDLLEDYE